jgi:hypothetical protein
MSQFESFRASQLYCQKCAKSMPVRERLLLVLPGKEIYEYLCTGCSSTLGQRDVIPGAVPPPVRSLPANRSTPMRRLPLRRPPR